MLLAGLAVALVLLLWAWRCRPRGAGSRGAQRGPWALVLRHWLALRVLGWAVGWQRRHLEQASRDVRRSQESLRLRLQGGAGAAEPDSAKFQERRPLAQPGSDGPETPARPALPTGPWALLRHCFSANSPLQGPVLYLDVLSRVFPEALSPLGTARFSWARGCSLPAAAWPLPTLYCAPEEAGTVPSRATALYLQLLFAVRERGLRALEAGLLSELYDALGVLRAGWEGLVQDLASGQLSPRLELPEGTRRRLEGLLSPDVARAAELRAACAGGWDGVARRLWPRLRVVVVAEPRGEWLYREALQVSECQGLPFYCPFYSAAGALLGVNLWPEQPDSRYLLCPGWAFYEFLPAGPGTEGPSETLLLEEVQEGQEYELVLTAQAGLSRCRLGEVLKVAEFHNQCPVVGPVRRLSQTLSARGEGVPEEQFYRSLRRAAAMWPGARLVDYVCAESSLLGASSGACAPHYQVFVELRGVRDLSEVQRYKVSSLGRGSWSHRQGGVFLPLLPQSRGLELEGGFAAGVGGGALPPPACRRERSCLLGALAPPELCRCPRLAWALCLPPPPAPSVLPWLGLATRWQHLTGMGTWRGPALAPRVSAPCAPPICALQNAPSLGGGGSHRGREVHCSVWGREGHDAADEPDARPVELLATRSVRGWERSRIARGNETLQMQTRGDNRDGAEPLPLTGCLGTAGHLAPPPAMAGTGHGGQRGLGLPGQAGDLWGRRSFGGGSDVNLGSRSLRVAHVPSPCSWISVSRRIFLSTNPSASRAAWGRCGCTWWRPGPSGSCGMLRGPRAP